VVHPITSARTGGRSSEVSLSGELNLALLEVWTLGAVEKQATVAKLELVGKQGVLKSRCLL